MLLWRLLAPAEPIRVDVIVAARDMVSGTQLTDSDLTVASVPEQWRPVGSASPQSRGDIVGRVLSVPLVQGETVSPHQLVPRGPADGLPPGRVAVHVVAADPAGLALIHPGLLVTLYPAAGGPAVAHEARVLSVDPPPLSEVAALVSEGSRGLTVAVAPAQSEAIHTAPRADEGPPRVVVAVPGA